MTTLTHPVTLDGGKVHITQEFGDDFAWQGKQQFYRQHYGLQGHNGIDYGGTHIHGHPVTAAADGAVIYSGLGDYWDSTVGGGAHVVILDHGDILTGYLHLIANSQTVHAGQRVKRGHVIGKAGNTGVGTGSHLHFQVMPKPFNRWNNWGCVDPRKYMTATVTAQAASKPLPAKTGFDELMEQIMSWYKNKADFEAAMLSIAKKGALEPLYYRGAHPDPKKAAEGERDPRDTYDYIRNPGKDVWDEPIASTYDKPDKNGKRRAHPASSHLSVINDAANKYRFGDGRDAIIKELVAEIAKTSKGAPLDIDALVAKVQASAEAGVKNAIESIETTTTVNLEQEAK